MTEEDAQAWVKQHFAEPTFVGLQRYVDLLLEANATQNLIAPSTVSKVWARHIVDSLQLTSLAPVHANSWLDVGSGAGLPGVVVALTGRFRVTLSEPRALRVNFLRECIVSLDIAEHAAVEPCKAQLLEGSRFDIVSARAVATASALLEMTRHLTDKATTYLLPKGVSAAEDVLNVRRNWAGTFHVEQSIVDPTSGIIVASGVRRK